MAKWRKNEKIPRNWYNRFLAKNPEKSSKTKVLQTNEFSSTELLQVETQLKRVDSSEDTPKNYSTQNVKKEDAEYLEKREKNNIAVRKSRTKAKLKHIETQMRVGELTEENNQLRNRVQSLQKELDILKCYIACSTSNQKFKTPYTYSTDYNEQCSYPLLN